MLQLVHKSHQPLHTNAQLLDHTFKQRHCTMAAERIMKEQKDSSSGKHCGASTASWANTVSYMHDRIFCTLDVEPTGNAEWPQPSAFWCRALTAMPLYWYIVHLSVQSLFSRFLASSLAFGCPLFSQSNLFPLSYFWELRGLVTLYAAYFLVYTNCAYAGKCAGGQCRIVPKRLRTNMT